MQLTARHARRCLVVLGGALALLGSSVGLGAASPGPDAKTLNLTAAIAPAAFGWCDFDDPSAWTDGKTVASATLGWDGAVVQLRYSPSTRCIWARMINGAHGDQVCIHRNSDQKGSCVLQTNWDKRSIFTLALDDAGVTSYALVRNDNDSTQTSNY